MDCQEADAALDCLMDGEAPLHEQRQVLTHLEVCARCREEYAYRQLLQRTIRQNGANIQVPEQLWDDIRARLDHVDRLRRLRPKRWLHWGALAGCAGALALVLATLLGPWGFHPPASPFMTESVNNYIRYLLEDAPYDLRTSDADLVRRWFQGRLDFMAAPPDLQGEGFQLVGTRLGYFLDRLIAEMGYRRDSHHLSLFITKGNGIDRLAGERVSVGGQEFFINNAKGYTVVAWRDAHANVVCSVVADLDRDQLFHIALKVARVQS
jgi:anti-sigma factor RsiW